MRIPLLEIPVVSYTTFSPLSRRPFSPFDGLFSVALSVNGALPPFPVLI